MKEFLHELNDEKIEKMFSTMYRKVDENGIKSDEGHREMYRGIIGLRIANRDYLQGLSGEVATCLVFGVRTIGFAFDGKTLRVNSKCRGNKIFDEMLRYFIDKYAVDNVEDVDCLPTKVVPSRSKKSLDDLIANATVVDDIEGF